MLDDLFDKELYEKDLKQIAYEEGEQIGRQQGIQQGIQQHLIDQVRKKLEKGKTIEEIADALEESVGAIMEIVAEMQ
jgi:predicted transposase YdaD